MTTLGEKAALCVTDFFTEESSDGGSAPVTKLPQGAAFYSFAPGRINLIGEHVDYMGGLVVPAALDLGVLSWVSDPNKEKGGNNEKRKLLPGLLCFQSPSSSSEADREINVNMRALATVVRMLMQRDEAEAKENSGADQEHTNKKKKDPAEVAMEWSVVFQTMGVREGSWGYYVLGVVVEAIKNEILVGGGGGGSDDLPIDDIFEEAHKDHSVSITVMSSLPQGAGVSSSAALSISLIHSVGHALGCMTSHPQVFEDTVAMAKRAQSIEQQYKGVNCGIMDPFASIHGKAGHFLELDCGTLSYKHHKVGPLYPEGNCGIVLINSMKKHQLGDQYNKLRAELEEAERKVSKFLHSSSSAHGLGSLEGAPTEAEPSGTLVWLGNQCKTSAESRAAVDKILAGCGASESQFERASYVVHETRRTLEMFQVLDRDLGDISDGKYDTLIKQLKDLGHLLNETHAGLSKQLLVSTPELDFIQDQLMNKIQVEEGLTCYGCRMMGGGFGGCVLAFMQDSTRVTALAKLEEAFNQQFPETPMSRKASIHDATLGDGAFHGCLSEQVEAKARGSLRSE